MYDNQGAFRVVYTQVYFCYHAKLWISSCFFYVLQVLIHTHYILILDCQGGQQFIEGEKNKEWR